MGLLDHKGSFRGRKLQRSPAIQRGSPVSPVNPAGAPWHPTKPIWQIYKPALYAVAIATEKERKLYFKTALTEQERVITEQLEAVVFQEMERRAALIEKAVAEGRDPEQAELTPLQKKAAVAACILQDGVNLPLPFSATPRKVSDPSTLPAACGTPLIIHRKDVEGFKEESWETVSEMSRYLHYYGFEPTTQKRVKSMSGRMIDTIRAVAKNTPSKKDDDDEPNALSQVYRDIVADFITQEKAVFASRRNGGAAIRSPAMGGSGSLFRENPLAHPSGSTTGSLLEGIAHLARKNSAQHSSGSTESLLKDIQLLAPKKSVQLSPKKSVQFAASSATRMLRGNDDSQESSLDDPANHTLVSSTSIDGAPLTIVNSNETTIKHAIFDGKDGALKPDQLIDFRNSVSAPGGLARNETIDSQPEAVGGSKSMVALAPPRPPSPALADNDKTPKRVSTSLGGPSPALAEDDDTPKRVSTNLVGGLKRVETMNNLHALRGASGMSDLYSNPDDIASPVPFSAAYDAGDMARSRRRGRTQEDEDNQESSPRHSLAELSEHAIVDSRLEATKAEEEKSMTSEERRKQQKKAKIQSKLDYAEQLKEQASKMAEKQRQRLENFDGENYSSPRDDVSSPIIPIGKQGSQLFLRRDKLTTFSEFSLFSDDGVPTPRHAQAVNNYAHAVSNLFSSPQRKSSPLAQPPMTARDTVSMSKRRNYSAGPSSSESHLHGFPLPPTSGYKLQLQKEQHLTVPSMGHPSSDDILPSSPSNKFGSVGARGKWNGKSVVREHAENLFSDDADPQVNKRLSRIPKPINQSSPFIAKFQEKPETPSGPLPKAEISPNEFAPGVIRKNSGPLIGGRVKGRKRSASVENKLKQLYVDQTDGRSVYSTPAISSEGDVAPPALMSTRADVYEVNRSPSAQKMLATTAAMIELNTAMLERLISGQQQQTTTKPQPAPEPPVHSNDGEESAEESEMYYSAKSSPQHSPSEYVSHSPALPIPGGSRSASGLVSSMARSWEDKLHGAKSLPMLSGASSPRPFLSPASRVTSQRTLLAVPTGAPMGSSPLRRVASHSGSPEHSLQGGGRSFLPQSHTIPQSLVAQSTITRAGDGPINRSPEREPYMDRSGPSMYRLNSVMRLPEAGDADPDSFVKNAAMMIKWAENDGKRFSRGF